jgi:hypothetical protein
MHVVYPAFMATELGLRALGRDLRRPPRLTRRSVETVSRRILAQAVGLSLEISVSGRRAVPPGAATGCPLTRHWHSPRPARADAVGRQ